MHFCTVSNVFASKLDYRKSEKVFLYEVSLKKHLEKRHKITEKDLMRNLLDGKSKLYFITFSLTPCLGTL